MIIWHTTELVVLIDEYDTAIGTMPKSHVHSATTPLHRAFSCFVFDHHWNILLQQRAASKKTRPLVRSNSFCGHPSPDQSYEHAVVARCKYELGIDISIDLVTKICDYRYCFVRYWVMENEFCPIFVIYTDDTPIPNPDEVASIIYMPWAQRLHELHQDLPGDQWKRSEWCKEEAVLIKKRLNKENPPA